MSRKKVNAAGWILGYWVYADNHMKAMRRDFNSSNKERSFGIAVQILKSEIRKGKKVSGAVVRWSEIDQSVSPLAYSMRPWYLHGNGKRLLKVSDTSRCFGLMS